MNWNEYFMRIAEVVASKSKDSTKIGCVIVGPEHEIRSSGYNGFCRGVHDDVKERSARPEKYFWAEHAERNAIYNAARNGMALEGSSIYIWGEHPPCADCARAVIQSGIKKIFIKEPSTDSKLWQESWGRAQVMFFEAGVEIFYV